MGRPAGDQPQEVHSNCPCYVEKAANGKIVASLSAEAEKAGGV